MQKKLLVICGPTGTGKTDLAISLAHHFDGEIISADSRQVYQGMDIGTGKDLPTKSVLIVHNSLLDFRHQEFSIGFRKKDDIPIWLVDIVKPDYRFNVGEYEGVAKKVIEDIRKRQKLPIVVGGTGLYIKALIEPLSWISIPLDNVLRQRLEMLSLEQLQKELQSRNQNRWDMMNESDRKNPRRLIRAIEISRIKNQVVHSTKFDTDILLLGLAAPNEILKEKIETRVEKRVAQGIVEEIKGLLAKGYHWDLPAMSGLGYNEWRKYFEGEITIEVVIRLWKLHELQYAKRQMTWFRKQQNIEWFSISQQDVRQRIVERVRVWYNK